MPELSRSLQPRHITMISIGGMIGAGLFVSSSAAIAARTVARTALAAPGADGS
jgi:amino acid permease